MEAASHVRRKRVMRLLRAGLVTIAEAASLALVSRQRVHQWCVQAGIDIAERRKEWLATQHARLDREEHEMTRRNWSKAKTRKPTEDVRYDPGIMAPLLQGRERAPQPSKAELQAEAAAALARSRKPIVVKRVAAVHTFRCLDCREYNRRRTELVCAKCGSHNTQRAV